MRSALPLTSHVEPSRYIKGMKEFGGETLRATSSRVNWSKDALRRTENTRSFGGLFCNKLHDKDVRTLEGWILM